MERNTDKNIYINIVMSNPSYRVDRTDGTGTRCRRMMRAGSLVQERGKRIHNDCVG